jgi:ankyrin repeat protein
MNINEDNLNIIAKYVDNKIYYNATRTCETFKDILQEHNTLKFSKYIDLDDDRMYNNKRINHLSIRYLIKYKKLRANYNHNYLLRHAAKHGKLKLFKYLLRHKYTDVTDHDNDAIILASSYGHYHIVCLLLENTEIDPTVNRNVAYKTALKFGHYAVANLLMTDYRVKETIYIELVVKSKINKLSKKTEEALHKRIHLSSNYVTMI